MEALILILDNNEFDRRILNEVLTAERYAVVAADPHNDVLQQLKESVPDCAFVSERVGNQDGVALIQQIRREPVLENVPVIYLTTMERPDKQIEALRAGANLYLVKPFDHAELLTQLDVQLRIRRLQTELQEQLEINQDLLRQVQTDLALGQQVQQSFLPAKQLRTENFALEAQLIAGGDLSGDYFDYKLITPDQLVVFLADVSGHGVAAALLASRLKAFFDENLRLARRPRVYLEKLNNVLISLGEHFHIATAVFLNIDMVEMTVTCASAGHRTLYWLNLEADTHYPLRATGPALGMFDDYDINETAQGFMPGRNRLVAYTDGLVEFKLPDGTWYTEDQFRDNILLPHATLPIAEYVSRLLIMSRELTGGSGWDDDVSLLVADF